MANKDRIFTEEMKSPYFLKQGYYGNLLPTVARLYEKKIANFKPIGNEDARTIREEENRRLLQSPKSAVSTESIRQVEEAAKGVLPKSSQ